jgi:CheY-like chemotaxis protein
MSNFVTLLVEEDALQREMLADVLKDEGFEVIECATGKAAELVIASTGTELQCWSPITTWQARCPVPLLLVMQEADTLHMNIIIMSGRTMDDPVGTTFLQKPFWPAQLLDAVRD